MGEPVYLQVPIGDSRDREVQAIYGVAWLMAWLEEQESEDAVERVADYVSARWGR